MAIAVVDNSSPTSGDLHSAAWSKYNATVTALLLKHDSAGSHKSTGDVVLKALFDANTILAANSDDTPAALTIAEQRLVGRITGGSIVGLTAVQGRALLDVYTTGVVAGSRFFNLCRNATFASRSGGTSAKPDEWVLERSPTIAYDTVDVGYGDFAVKLTAVGLDSEGILQVLTNLKPSTKYQVFVRAKATAGDTARLLTTGATTNVDEEITSTSWVSLTGEFTTDASATNVSIRLLAKLDTDIVWFCGVTCVEGDIPPANFIRRVHEWIFLTTKMTDTNFDGDAFSDVEADIDLSSFGNGCPPKIKAVLVFAQCRDSGSGAASAQLHLNPGGIDCDWDKSIFMIILDFVSNDTRRALISIVPCDANGDIRYEVFASGANTLDVWIQIWGYLLGE